MTDQAATVRAILSNRGYSVNKQDLGYPKLLELKKNLTVTPEAHPDYPAPQSFPLYEEVKNWIRIPRAYGIIHFGEPKWNFPDNTFQTSCVFAGMLRENQRHAHDTVLEHLRDQQGNRSGLLCLPTGHGKTTVALSIISHLKQRTCILIHKSQLLQQWKEEIHRFLPTMKVGIIQQSKKDLTVDCDIYLVMIQTLLNLDTVPPIFGTTVIDECHHIPSATFSKVLFKVNALHVLGLTATPNRKDGLTEVLHWHIGDTIFQERPDRREQKTTHVEIYRYEPKMRWMDLKKYAQTISNLCSDPQRNALILQAIDQQLEKDTKCLRRMLILTERVSHAKILHGALCKRYESTATFRKGNQRTCGILIGGMKKQMMEEEMRKMILVATYNLMSEGISIAHLNSIVFASPKKDVVQALGRIFRKVHQDVNPLIIDISDCIFRGQERARLSTYKRELNGNILVHVHEPDDDNDNDVQEDVEKEELNANANANALPKVYRDMLREQDDDNDPEAMSIRRTCLLNESSDED